jgi:hypothetical protein
MAAPLRGADARASGSSLSVVEAERGAGVRQPGARGRGNPRAVPCGPFLVNSAKVPGMQRLR